MNAISAFNALRQQDHENLIDMLANMVDLDEEEMTDKRKEVHALYKERDAYGVLATLVERHLIFDEPLFQSYFRVSRALFERIFVCLQPDLEPRRSYSHTISTTLKLCITIR